MLDRHQITGIDVPGLEHAGVAPANFAQYVVSRKVRIEINGWHTLLG